MRPMEIGRRPPSARPLWASFSVRPTPRDFRVGEDNRRNGRRGAFLDFTVKKFHGRLSFMRRFVGKHRVAGDVTNGEDIRIGRSPRGVYRDEAAVIYRDVCVLQA